jgi:hypothetical protein
MEIIERRKINPIPRGAITCAGIRSAWGRIYRYAHQLIYIFSGSGTGRLDTEECRLEPGMFVTYSPGTLHEFRSDPGVRLTAATCVSPGAMSATGGWNSPTGEFRRLPGILGAVR